MAPAPKPSLTWLLKRVSRSFYLTLRVLPPAVRPQLSLAYLLARTTDTIADTQLVPLQQRKQSLRTLREHIQSPRAAPLDFGELARHQGSPAERMLLETIETSLALLRQFTPPDRDRIRSVLNVITSGQELDLDRFAGASAARITALQNDAELDDYTWRVAGCVGEFWTDLCLAHAFTPADQARLAADAGRFKNLGVRFGKGLQLVNILRDLPRDVAHGRCYLPVDRLRAVNLVPCDLLDPRNEPRFRPLYDEYLAAAREHLAAGWEYTHLVPRRAWRIRLACAWPILIGIETIDRLRAATVLDPRQRVKISRAALRRIVFRSVVRYPWPERWRRLFRV